MAEGANSSEFDYAESWGGSEGPDPGDVVKGEVTELTEYAGGGYGSYPILTLRQEDGSETAVHCFHTALRNQLAELNVQSGDQVGILYKGKVQKKNGSGTYESYRVKRLNQSPTRFDWSKERADALEDPSDDDISPHAPLEEAVPANAREEESPF